MIMKMLLLLVGAIGFKGMDSWQMPSDVTLIKLSAPQFLICKMGITITIS